MAVVRAVFGAFEVAVRLSSRSAGCIYCNWAVCLLR